MYETTLTVAHSLLNPLWVSETYCVDEFGEQVFLSANVNGHSVCEDAAVAMRISMTQEPPAGVRVKLSLISHQSPIFNDSDVAEHVQLQLTSGGRFYSRS